MPKVWNKRDPNCPKDAVYVGRPTKWGNPFSHLPSSTARWTIDTRENAVIAYRNQIASIPAIQKMARSELKGKDLVCWCAPKSCHADVLLEIANAE